MVDPVPAAPDDIDFEQSIDAALDSLPRDLREFMSNVSIVVEEEPPPGMQLLGLSAGRS
jgi:predicted Zn-dependent protease with MMP-like domain